MGTQLIDTFNNKKIIIGVYSLFIFIHMSIVCMVDAMGVFPAVIWCAEKGMYYLYR